MRARATTASSAARCCASVSVRDSCASAAVSFSTSAFARFHSASARTQSERTLLNVTLVTCACSALRHSVPAVARSAAALSRSARARASAASICSWVVMIVDKSVYPAANVCYVGPCDARSLGARARSLDDLAVFFVFVPDVGGEFLRRAARGVGHQYSQPLLEIGRDDDFDRFALELVDDGPPRFGGNAQPVPAVGLILRPAGLRERRHVRQIGPAGGTGEADRVQPPAFHVRGD